MAERGRPWISMASWGGGGLGSASQVAQWWRIHLPVQETPEMQVCSLGHKDPLEKGMATHSSILAWKIPRREEPGGLQSMGLQRVRHDWAVLMVVGGREGRVRVFTAVLSYNGQCPEPDTTSQCALTGKEGRERCLPQARYHTCINTVKDGTGFWGTHTKALTHHWVCSQLAPWVHVCALTRNHRLLLNLGLSFCTTLV